MRDESVTVVVATNNDDVLHRNLLASPGLIGGAGKQLIVKRNFASASLAYNSALDEAASDIVVFVHQDVFLPEGWFAELLRSIESLEQSNVRWGVVGCFGSTKGAHGGLGRVYTRGLGYHGRQLRTPEAIDTLDEIVLVLRKSSGIRFDPLLPHFHLYGTDVCITAREMGFYNFAFQGFCIHNTNQLLCLPKEFYACYRYVRAKWANHLPIYTACLRISLLNEEFYRKRITEAGQRLLGITGSPLTRVNDPRDLCR